jgi:hypothetical protein
MLKKTQTMEQEIKPGIKIFIRNTVKNDYWLQDIIYTITGY